MLNLRFFLLFFLIEQLFLNNMFSIALAKEQRIVSLGPDLTEILISLDLSDKIVCTALPVSKALNTGKVKIVGYYYKPVLEKIVKCKPDIILSTYAGTPKNIHEKLEKLGYKILLYKAVNINSIKEYIKKIAAEFNVPFKKLTSKFDGLCVKDYYSETKKTDKTKFKKAITIIGFNPIYVAGKNSFISDAIKCAGLINEVSGDYPRLSIENIIKINPDYLIIPDGDFKNFKDYKILIKTFKGRIIYIDPNKLFIPSMSVIEGIDRLKSETGL